MIGLVVFAAPTAHRHLLSLAAVPDTTQPGLVVLTPAYPEVHLSHVICIELHKQWLRIGNVGNMAPVITASSIYVNTQGEQARLDEAEANQPKS